MTVLVVDVDTSAVYQAKTKKGAKAAIKEAGLTKALLVMASVDSMARQLTATEIAALWVTNLKESLPVEAAFNNEEELARLAYPALCNKPRLKKFTKC